MVLVNITRNAGGDQMVYPETGGNATAHVGGAEVHRGHLKCLKTPSREVWKWVLKVEIGTSQRQWVAKSY